jgi:hypothetical protein
MGTQGRDAERQDGSDGVRAELKQVNRELKQLRAQVAALEERRSVLLAELGEQRPGKPG